MLFLKNNSLFKKFLSFSFGGWVGLLVGLASTPITTRLFSPDQLGKASMFTLAVNVLMIFLVFGRDQAYVRFYYEEEEPKRPWLLRRMIYLPLLLAGLSVIPIMYFQEAISLFLFEQKLDYLGPLLILGILFSLLNRFGVLAVRMQQLGKLFSYLQILLKVFTLSFLILMFYLHGNLFKGVIYGQVLTWVVVALFAMWWGRKAWIGSRSGGVIKHSAKDVLSYSAPLVLTTLVMWLFQSFDRIAVKEYSDFSELGIYVAAFRVVVLLNIVQTSFTSFWTPVAYEQYEKNPLNTFFYEKMHIVVSVSMLALGTVSIMAKDVITLIVGEEYRLASQVMPFLIFMPVMYTISETTVLGIGFKKKTQWTLGISVVVCLANILGNYWLVPILGAKGAAVSTGVSYILFLLLRTWVGWSFYKIDFHIWKLLSGITVLSVYAYYNTVNTWSLELLGYGMLVLTFIGVIYFKSVVHVLKKDRVENGKS